jgi:asparagine synthase (glutamine-hydrolysing)
MVAAQIHRGPDDSGEEVVPFGSGFLGLGHRRLSIIDLSPAGHQPMVHPQTGDQIVFNGEIYNFQRLRRELLDAGETFVGHSDTEVLLHGLSRWGAEYIKRLHGMFAFAFHNAREQTVLLARDSIGIKPLYLAVTPQAILFASEVRAIIASGLVEPHLDLRGVAGLLAYGAVQRPCTIFKGIRSFPPGSYQVFAAGGDPARQGMVRFWDYPSPHGDLTEERVLPELGRTLEDSVRDHLVSDVPVGVFLSSGLDSTIVAGLAARHTPRLKSFTVAFADQPDLSEGALAGETAGLFGLDHTEIQITGRDAEQAAIAWLRSLDQPSMDGLNIYIISKAVHARGITVALSGQGGDELFGGYPSFQDVPLLRRIMRWTSWLPGPVRQALAATATVGRSEAVRRKFADIIRTDGSVLALCLQRRRVMSDQQLAFLGIDAQSLGLSGSFLPPEAITGLNLDGSDVVAAVSQIESLFYQGNTLLRDGDTNSMAHGLEIRVPMLDQRMLDLVCAVPGQVRLPSGSPGKYLLRRAFAPLLRPALTAGSKRGFTLPIRRWMIGPMRDLCQQALLAVKAIGCLRPEGVDAIWDSFLRDPESPIWSRAFTLCVLGFYCQHMGSPSRPLR